MLSPSALLEIKTELDSLRALQQKVAERIAVLEAAQQPFDFGGQGTLPLGSNGARPSSAPDIVTTTATIQVKNAFASTGLREHVLGVLRSRGPMRAPDVSRVLLANGFLNDSKTPLSTRVYNDLWRLSQKKIVTVENGVFSVK